jgi:hypothetical protein
MTKVNHDMEEMEFDYYLSLAKIFDEGYPSIPHAPISNASIPVCPADGKGEKCDPTPEEYATNDAPFRE